MIEFLSAPQNFPFSVALALMLGLAFLEGVGTLLGLGFSSFMETLLPEIDSDIDIDGDLDAHNAHPGSFDASEVPATASLSRILSWLRIGKVPVLILLIIFLTSFGLVGLGLQSFLKATIGFMMPAFIVAAAAFFLSMPAVRVLGGAMEYLIPKDETEAVSESSFVGRIATITLGTARSGNPAEAKLTDEHGQIHYLMVEPDEDEAVFPTGENVLLIKRDGAIFRAIINKSDLLVD